MNRIKEVVSTITDPIFVFPVMGIIFSAAIWLTVAHHIIVMGKVNAAQAKMSQTTDDAPIGIVGGDGKFYFPESIAD